MAQTIHSLEKFIPEPEVPPEPPKKKFSFFGKKKKEEPAAPVEETAVVSFAEAPRSMSTTLEEPKKSKWAKLKAATKISFKKKGPEDPNAPAALHDIKRRFAEYGLDELGPDEEFDELHEYMDEKEYRRLAKERFEAAGNPFDEFDLDAEIKSECSFLDNEDALHIQAQKREYDIPQTEWFFRKLQSNYAQRLGRRNQWLAYREHKTKHRKKIEAISDGFQTREPKFRPNYGEFGYHLPTGQVIPDK